MKSSSSPWRKTSLEAGSIDERRGDGAFTRIGLGAAVQNPSSRWNFQRMRAHCEWKCDASFTQRSLVNPHPPPHGPRAVSAATFRFTIFRNRFQPIVYRAEIVLGR